MAYYTHYVVGVSVGVMSQPTAIAVIEQESLQKKSENSEIQEIRLRHLERMPSDASYPDLAKKLRAIEDGLEPKEQASDTDLMVDMTGTGKRIIDFLRDEDLEPTRVVISAGHGERRDDTGLWRISKVELVGSLQVLFQTDKFKVSSGLDLVDALQEELMNFRMKAQPLNAGDIESWREGKSDDLVFAVAIATWQAQRDIPSCIKVIRRSHRPIDNNSWMR